MERSFRVIAVGAALFSFIMAGCGPSAPAIPATPDGTFTTVMHSLAEGKPEVVWAALPASYQKQLQDEVVRTFATKMDADIYNKGVAVLKKLSGILSSKKDFIIPQLTAHPMFQMAQVDKAKVEQNWGKVIGLVDTVLASELGDLNKLKSVDVGSFLRVTGGKVMGQIAALSALSEQDPYAKEFKAKLSAVTAEIVSTEGDTATVKVATAGESPDTIKFVKVEGKWLPEDMVEGWNDFIAKAKEQIDQIKPETLTAQKPQIMGVLAGVEAMLDQLANAKTAEEFQTMAGGLMENLPIPGMGGM
jgi:hypothetical protein